MIRRNASSHKAKNTTKEAANATVLGWKQHRNFFESAENRSLGSQVTKETRDTLTEKGGGSMKRFYQITGTVLLTVFLAIGANAATKGANAPAKGANAPTNGNQGVTDNTQGIQNAKKVMQYRIQREKNMHALQAQGQEKKMQENSQRPQQAPKN